MGETLSSIVDTIQEKLGKEEAGKIADSLANILVIEEANTNGQAFPCFSKSSVTEIAKA